MASSNSPAPTSPAITVVVKEGWLLKRGEHIKNWRPRYFILKSDGSFFGFRAKPDPGGSTAEPSNNFTARHCQVTKAEAPRANTFIVRVLQLQTSVDRTFCTETSEERNDWIEAIMSVSDRLKGSAKSIQSSSTKSNRQSSSTKSHDEERETSGDSNRVVTLEDFAILRLLGQGSFGKVLLARHKGNKKCYAVKVLKKSVILEKDEVEHTITENRVLRRNRHPFLTQLKYSFQTEDRLFFVMEFANGGELFFHLSPENPFSEDRARFYAAEIVSALDYLHQQGTIYRDLKLENVLLDIDGHVKISDFGICKEKMFYGTRTNTFCGTPEYIPPEILEDDEYGHAVDWWALGIVLYEMMCAELPFFNKDQQKMYESIINDPVRFPPKLSSQARDIITRLLDKNPRLRLGGGQRDAKDVMEHPFFVTINWQDLVDKKVPPPWKPKVTGDNDTKYFAQQFTSQNPRLTPPNEKKSMPSINDARFNLLPRHFCSSQASLDRLEPISSDDNLSTQLPRTYSRSSLSQITEAIS